MQLQTASCYSCIWHFYNIIFILICKIHIALGSASFPQIESSGSAPACEGCAQTRRHESSNVLLHFGSGSCPCSPLLINKQQVCPRFCAGTKLGLSLWRYNRQRVCDKTVLKRTLWANRAGTSEDWTFMVCTVQQEALEWQNRWWNGIGKQHVYRGWQLHEKTTPRLKDPVVQPRIILMVALATGLSSGVCGTATSHCWFFSHGAAAPSGPGPPHYRDFTITRNTPQPVRPLWTSDQSYADPLPEEIQTLIKDRHPCTRRDSNPQFQQASCCRSTP